MKTYATYALLAGGIALIVAASDSIHAQGRGGQNWNTASADALARAG